MQAVQNNQGVSIEVVYKALGADAFWSSYYTILAQVTFGATSVSAEAAATRARDLLIQGFVNLRTDLGSVAGIQAA